MQHHFTPQIDRKVATMGLAAVCCATVFTGALAAQGAQAQAVPAAPSSATESTPAQATAVYSVPFDDALYVVERGFARQLTLAEWAALGYPKPTAGATEYQRYAWSDRVAAIVKLPGLEVDPFPRFLTAEQLKRAGNPTAKVVAWIPQTLIYKFAYSDELFVALVSGGIDKPREAHKLTYAEWASMGYPAYSPSESGFAKFKWLDTVFELGDVDARAISYEQWVNEGFQTPLIWEQRTYSWTFAANGVDIIFTYPYANYTKIVTPAEWAAAGYPKPTRG